jgi:hypothetical protein
MATASSRHTAVATVAPASSVLPAIVLNDEGSALANPAHVERKKKEAEHVRPGRLGHCHVSCRYDILAPGTCA